jgi:hypothetical protein
MRDKLFYMRTLRRPGMARCLAICWAVLTATSVGFGAELTLQNDSFSGTGSVICISGQSFAEGEMAAARFTAPPGAYPFQVQAIQVLACPLGTQADLVLKIWHDDGLSNEPGDLIYEEFFTLVGSDVALNELDVSVQNITIDSGGLRVGVQYYFGPALTGLATDIDGHIEPQPNFIYAIPPSAWTPAHLFGVNGDWIIRVVIDANDEPPIFVDGFESGDTDLWSDVEP